MLWVPTSIRSIRSARPQRGPQGTAAINDLLVLTFIAFRQLRSPHDETRASDHWKPSTAFASLVSPCTTSTQTDTNGPNKSARITFLTCRNPRAEISSTILTGPTYLIKAVVPASSVGPHNDAMLDQQLHVIVLHTDAMLDSYW